MTVRKRRDRMGQMSLPARHASRKNTGCNRHITDQATGCCNCFWVLLAFPGIQDGELDLTGNCIARAPVRLTLHCAGYSILGAAYGTGAIPRSSAAEPKPTWAWVGRPPRLGGLLGAGSRRQPLLRGLAAGPPLLPHFAKLCRLQEMACLHANRSEPKMCEGRWARQTKTTTMLPRYKRSPTETQLGCLRRMAHSSRRQWLEVAEGGAPSRAGGPVPGRGQAGQ